MNDIELTKKRNNLLVLVLAAVITVDEMLSYSIGISLQFILFVLGIIFFIIVPVTLLSNLPKFTRTIPYIKYFYTFVIGISLFYIIKLDPHMINIMTMFFYIVMMGIYQSRIVNLLTLIITLSILCFYFFTQGTVIFHSTNVQDLFFYIITFCFVSGTTHVYALFNDRLQKEKEQKTQRAIEAKSVMEDMLTKITESLQFIKQYQNELCGATHAANQRSIEIIFSINSIIKSIENQNKQALLLSSQVHQAKKQITETKKTALIFHGQAASSSSAPSVSYESAPTEKTLADLTLWLQDIEAQANMTVEKTAYNKESLTDVLQLVSIQQQEIESLSESFTKLEKQLSRINRRNDP